LQAHAAINHSDNINTQSRRQFLNLHISRVQLFLQNYKAALELLDKTIAESHQHNLTERLPELYLNRAYAARELNGLSEQSVDTFIQAARMGKNQGNKKVELAGYNNAGAGLLLLKDYQQSEHYLTLARDIASSINSHAETAVINFNLGYIKVLRGEYDQGLAEMREAVSRFSQYAPASQVAQIQGLLADAYAVAGRYQLQAETLKEQLRLKDEFFQSEREKVLAELQIKYQAQENALQIKLLLSCRLRS
jgi:tetratricopeptide (TPR) repeat protein